MTFAWDCRLIARLDGTGLDVYAEHLMAPNIHISLLLSLALSGVHARGAEVMA